MRSSIGIVLAAVCLLACAGSAWERVRAEDTAAAYDRYLRDYADSDHASEARARLALVRLRSKPTANGYDAFRAEFPDETLLAELRPSVEPRVFERVRAIGTPSAYREFLEDFGAGALAERARGNLEFLEAAGFGARPDALAAFARATSRERLRRRSAAQRRCGFVAPCRAASGGSGLAVEIAPGTPSPDRLVRVFSERAMQRYAEAGIALVPLGRRAGSERGVAARAPHDPTPGGDASRGLRRRARQRAPASSRPRASR